MNHKYIHQWLDGAPIEHLPNKAICVGRNFVAHAKELNNPLPSSPLLFMKPYSAFRDLTQPLHLSSKLGTIHYECELVILIGQSIGPHHNIAVEEAIEGIGLGLDLTLRDLQSQLKKQGHPWERAKSFDGSCVVGPMIPFDKSMSLDDIHFRLLINESLKQEGHSALMIFSITTLITQISEIFTLSPGDIIMTGTPAGVGELNDGDSLTLTLGDQYHISTQVKIDE